MAKLCLGTAQFGMKYGINNKVGKPSNETVFEILDIAIKSGIDTIDTASAYGEAEVILGEYLSMHQALSKKIRIISKISCTTENVNDTELETVIRGELEQSLFRLKRDCLDGYLLHSYRAIDQPEILSILKRIKREGIVRKVGASVYDIDEAERAIEGGIDYLQMPYNVFDQRGLTSGIFQKAKENGVCIFTRSAFLQGLLMMEESDIPFYLQDIVPYVRELSNILSKYNYDKRSMLLNFVLSEQMIDYIVFGVETKEQLNEILKGTCLYPLPESLLGELKEKFENISTNLILPINWKGL